jgi:hypothetical protein
MERIYLFCRVCRMNHRVYLRDGKWKMQKHKRCIYFRPKKYEHCPGSDMEYYIDKKQ